MEYTYSTADLNVKKLQQMMNELAIARGDRQFVVYGSSELIDKVNETIKEITFEGQIDNQMVEFPINYFLNGKEIKSLKRRRNKS